MRTCTTFPLILAVGALSPAFALAQQAPSASHLLRGTLTAAGAAVRGAEVFPLESLRDGSKILASRTRSRELRGLAI